MCIHTWCLHPAALCRSAGKKNLAGPMTTNARHNCGRHAGLSGLWLRELQETPSATTMCKLRPCRITRADQDLDRATVDIDQSESPALITHPMSQPGAKDAKSIEPPGIFGSLVARAQEETSAQASTSVVSPNDQVSAKMQPQHPL